MTLNTYLTNAMRQSSHLVLGHGTNDQRAHHSRQSTDTVGDAHQDASVAWSNVQVIDIKPWMEEKKKSKRETIIIKHYSLLAVG